MRNRRWVRWALLMAGFAIGLGSAQAQSPEAAVGDWSTLAVGGSFNASRLQYGQHWLLGGTAFVDANFTWRYGIEGETNWEVLRQVEQTHATTYLIGPRYQLAGMGQNAQWRPYVKFLVGDGYFNFQVLEGCIDQALVREHLRQIKVGQLGYELRNPIFTLGV